MKKSYIAPELEAISVVCGDFVVMSLEKGDNDFGFKEFD